MRKESYADSSEANRFHISSGVENLSKQNINEFLLYQEKGHYRVRKICRIWSASDCKVN